MFRGDLADRRLFSPEALYILLSGSYVFFFTMVITVNLVYQTQEAQLNPFRLVLVGTVFEATRFLCEVPTGVIADTISRRLSILIGLVLVGVGLMLGGAFPHFETILLAQVVWGFGLTFISGAKEAWITDEIGVEKAGAVYLRSAQVEQVARVMAGFAGIGLGSIQLNLPILLGGGCLIPLAIFLALTMPERGFQPVRPRSGLSSMLETFHTGRRLIGSSSLLMTIFAISLSYNTASVSVERLWIAHFDFNLGLPTLWGLEPVIWYGGIRTGANILGIVSVGIARRFCDMSSHKGLTRSLFVLYGIQFLSFVGLTFAGGFVVGLIALWGIAAAVSAFAPLYIAWLNRNIDSSVRATVISMNNQVDSLGQIGGGPIFGAIGALLSLRAALFAGVVTMFPGLILFGRVYGLGPSEPSLEDVTAAAPARD